jgi:hypothetical protein
MANRLQTWVAAFIILLALAAVCVSIGLCLKTYMRCPFGDEWSVITEIARGRSPLSVRWLWTQHNEHRIAISRLLIWADLFWFGATTKSLFLEIFLVQTCHLGLVVWFVERRTRLDLAVRRTVQGLFAYCLFHPAQQANFTSAFQISFIMPFCITTAALLLLSFYEGLRHQARAGVIIALSPLLAALNMAGSLIAGPVLCAIGLLKGSRCDS